MSVGRGGRAGEGPGAAGGGAGSSATECGAPISLGVFYEPMGVCDICHIARPWDCEPMGFVTSATKWLAWTASPWTFAKSAAGGLVLNASL